MSSVLLTVVFLLAAASLLAAGLARSGRARALARTWGLPALLAAAVLVVLTAVFDNLMIAAGLFDYDWENMSGLRLGRMPLEDLAYPLGALLALPGLWLLTAPRRRAPADPAREPEA